ncbi:acyltransferase [Nocardioides stalactiti]|uniref:acyltransferase n=1 Tax=Nocardioides stalactiti TaxID=2755356 RepID=UPI001602C8C4|nr:acyltransferase [Nocardioides stalactiti]
MNPPVTIDATARVSALADLESSVRGTRLVIGARTVIDSFVKVKPAGGSGDVVIGDDVVINSGCVLYTGNGITIGNAVAIAANCVLAPANHQYDDPDVLIRDQGFRASKGGIVIEDDVWIGAGCVILDGAVIGRGAVIGAMTLVRGEVPPYAVAAGNPMQLRGSRR